MGAGLGKDVALITDGRFSGASHVNIELLKKIM
jgi:dihydroxyacid dehydratase/phosphogluconate dehydratase